MWLMCGREESAAFVVVSLSVTGCVSSLLPFVDVQSCHPLSWSFHHLVMFAKSTQHKHWMYGSVNELDRLRGEANQAYVDRHRSRTDLPDDQIFKYFLTFDEEKDLQLFYQNVLKEFCKSFQPPMPRTVVVSNSFEGLIDADNYHFVCFFRARHSSTTSDFTSTIQ